MSIILLNSFIFLWLARRTEISQGAPCLLDEMIVAFEANMFLYMMKADYTQH